MVAELCLGRGPLAQLASAASGAAERLAEEL